MDESIEAALTAAAQKIERLQKENAELMDKLHSPVPDDSLSFMCSGFGNRVHNISLKVGYGGELNDDDIQELECITHGLWDLAVKIPSYSESELMAKALKKRQLDQAELAEAYKAAKIAASEARAKLDEAIEALVKAACGQSATINAYLAEYVT